MEEALFPVQKNGRVGFINKAGQIVIDFELMKLHFSQKELLAFILRIEKAV